MTVFFKQYGLLLAWVIAILACTSSLFMSEALHWPVCQLCWYQRICIYPLVILLGIAAYREDKHIIPYAKTFCMLGFIVAIYQYAEQMIPGFSPINFCRQDVSCAVSEIKWFGFVTLPFLSVMACVAMYALLCLSKKETR